MASYKIGELCYVNKQYTQDDFISNPELESKFEIEAISKFYDAGVRVKKQKMYSTDYENEKMFYILYNKDDEDTFILITKYIYDLFKQIQSASPDGNAGRI